MKKWLVFLLALSLLGGIFARAEEQKKEISLKEAIYQALKNNLDLQIQIADAELSQKTLKINKAIFIPTFQLTGSVSENNEPSSGFLSGAEVTKDNATSLNAAFNQLLPLGGTLSLRLYSGRSTTNSIYQKVNPYIGSRATVVLTQPLLRDFGMTPTKREIYIASNNLKMAKHQLRQNIIELVYNVEQAYWNLVLAHQSYEATKMALQRAQDLLKQNEIKVKVGSAAPIEILTAKADVASNESSLIQAERTIQTAEENLKRILNMSKEEAVIIPADRPEMNKIPVDFNQFLLEGLTNRPDIERAKLDLENYKIRVKYARNQMLPTLNVEASYYTTGRGGTLYEYAPGTSPTDPDFNPETDLILLAKKTLGDSLDEVFSNLYKNYSVVLSLRMPLSFSSEKAQMAQARINLNRSLLSLKNTENTVHSEVKEVLKELEANAKLVEADRIALELQGQRLKAEEKRLAVGLTTNFIVLDYQRQYASAETQALRSTIDYTMTLARINRILARTFDVYDIKFKDFMN